LDPRLGWPVNHVSGFPCTFNLDKLTVVLIICRSPLGYYDQRQGETTEMVIHAYACTFYLI